LTCIGGGKKRAREERESKASKAKKKKKNLKLKVDSISIVGRQVSYSNLEKFYIFSLSLLVSRVLDLSCAHSSSHALMPFYISYFFLCIFPITFNSFYCFFINERRSQDAHGIYFFLKSFSSLQVSCVLCAFAVENSIRNYIYFLFRLLATGYLVSDCFLNSLSTSLISVLLKK
jgi:hypothetical protein